MDRVIQLNSRYAVAKFAPRIEDIRHFAERGFRSVVNMRLEDEKQDVKPDEEGEAARQAGLTYLHHPVKGDALTPDVVDEFTENVKSLPGPVLVHCASGRRSGALLMMHLGVEGKLTGKEAVRQAAELGLVNDAPELEGFMERYVDSRRGSNAADR